MTEVVPGGVLAGPEGLGVELGFTEPALEPHADNTMSALTGKRSRARINPGAPCKELSQRDRNDIAKLEFARAIVSQSAKCVQIERRAPFRRRAPKHPAQRRRYDAEDRRYRTQHEGCRVRSWIVDGSLTTHCGRRCPPAPLSPSQITKLTTLLRTQTLTVGQHTQPSNRDQRSSRRGSAANRSRSNRIGRPAGSLARRGKKAPHLPDGCFPEPRS